MSKWDRIFLCQARSLALECSKDPSTKAGLVIQAGIKRCVAPPMPEDKVERWGENMRLAEQQFREAGVELCILPLED